MIGSTDFSRTLIRALNEPLEQWEHSLEPNNDDFVCVDGEEGDYGLVSYYGPDAAGNNVRMMAKYVHGGDSEETYYTPEGVNHIRTVVFGNILGSVLDQALNEVLEPEGGEDGMFLGWLKAAEEAEKAAGVSGND
jgi:hypothetical protein